MPALTRAVMRTYELGDKHLRPMAAGVHIYQGSAVGLTVAGLARPLHAGDAFAGFAEDSVDNSQGTDSAVEVETKARGRILLMVPGFTVADVFKAVYASDDNTFTLTATSNSFVGRAVRCETPGLAIVEFDVARAA